MILGKIKSPSMRGVFYLWLLSGNYRYWANGFARTAIDASIVDNSHDKPP